MSVAESGTAWSAGRLDGAHGAPRVLFGRMYEDWQLEQAAFATPGRIFCIASAGCTAMHLAGRHHEVVAVDINPAQLAYASRRLDGAPMVRGSAEHVMRIGRALLPLAGWHAPKLARFLDLDDPPAQLAMWKRDFDTLRFRAAMDVLLSTATLGAAYASKLVASLPRRFASVMRARMERCFATHPNRTNPFARALLLGELIDDAPSSRPVRVEFACDDAAEFLRRAPPQSFDGFTLSNILDGADEGYRARLFAAVLHAARPGAPVVLRSFAEPSTISPSNRAAQDRSMLWGIVLVTPAAELAR